MNDRQVSAGLLIRGWLIHEKCTDIEFRGGINSFYFNMTGLHINSPWRVFGQDSIFGTGSSQQQESELHKILVGMTVNAVDFVNQWNDLRIVFDSGMILETFLECSEYENWNLVKPSQEGNYTQMIIAGPMDDLSELI